MGVFLILFLFICTMISQTVKAIIFDLGGVILNIDYQRTIEEFKKLGLENFETCFSQASQTKIFDDFETGQISSQHFINSLLPYLKEGTSSNKVVHAWNALILDQPKEKIDLLITLKKTYPLYLLSNTNALHVPVVRRRWAEVTPEPMEYFFNKIYFSHEIHLRKPNQEIFQLVCQEQKLEPSEVLFIDDSIQHVVGAQKFGLQTIHLIAPEQLYQIFS